MGFRAGLASRLVLLAVVIAWACPRADASARYTLTDLGTSGVGYLGLSYPYGGAQGHRYPIVEGYSTPQVDDSGAVHFGPGRTDAGSFHFQTYVRDVGGQRIGGDGEGDPSSVNASYSRSSYYTAEFGRVGEIPLPITYTSSFAGGINASGTAVGWDGEAFLYRRPVDGPRFPGDGESSIPGLLPGTVASFALGINGAGMIVGVTPALKIGAAGDIEIVKHTDWSGYPTDPWMVAGRAMLSDGTKTLDLNTLIAPGSDRLLTASTSINDLGQIAGYARDERDGSVHVFLLTPTPEPGVLTLFASAAGGLVAGRWARGWAGPRG